MKFYRLNYDFGDPLKRSIFKHYQSYDNAKRTMDQLINQALTQKGAKKYGYPNPKHFLNYVWVANNDHTILDVTITELSMED